MPTSEELLEKEIAILAEQLRIKRSALASMRQASALSKRPELPFIGIRATKAMQTILQEYGVPLTQDALIDKAVAGGASYGKKRGRHNVRIGLEMGLEAGTFKKLRGLVGLAEWEEGRFC